MLCSYNKNIIHSDVSYNIMSTDVTECHLKENVFSILKESLNRDNLLRIFLSIYGMPAGRLNGGLCLILPGILKGVP